MARVIDEGRRQNVVGDNVKKLRLAAGLSQKQLSERLETEAVYVCRGSLSRIESGDRTVTDIELVGFAKVLKVSIEKLFEK